MKSEIEKRLIAAFKPSKLEVYNDSADHAGHDAWGENSHFRVVIESERFKGLSLIEQHRLVNEVLGELLPEKIHALQLETRSPG